MTRKQARQRKRATRRKLIYVLSVCLVPNFLLLELGYQAIRDHTMPIIVVLISITCISWASAIVLRDEWARWKRTKRRDAELLMFPHIPEESSENVGSNSKHIF